MTALALPFAILQNLKFGPVIVLESCESGSRVSLRMNRQTDRQTDSTVCTMAVAIPHSPMFFLWDMHDPRRPWPHNGIRCGPFEMDRAGVDTNDLRSNENPLCRLFGLVQISPQKLVRKVHRRNDSLLSN